jgi:hypothetical protein
MKLNLGCGRNPMPDAFNVDITDLPGVDFVCDLNDAGSRDELGLALDSVLVTEIVGIDLIEHIPNHLALMEWLWSVVADGATCTFLLPYGSSDDAWEDPTHVRPFFLNSWIYYAQPTYWRADYGYRGDWQVESIVLEVRASQYAGVDPQEIAQDLMSIRNVVLRQEVTLRAVKPAREPKRELMQSPSVNFRIVEG